MFKRVFAVASAAVVLGLGLGAAQAANASTSGIHVPPVAVSWQDTSLQVNLLHKTCPVVPKGMLAETGSDSTTVTVTPAVGDVLTWSTLPVHVTAGAPNSTTGAVTFTSTATPSATENFVVNESYANGNPAGCVGALQIDVHTDGTLNTNVMDDGGSVSRNYVVGGVQFLHNVPTGPSSFNFNVPQGIAVNNGELVVAQSTAVPNTYSSQGVVATDHLGAEVTYAFELVVQGNKVVVITPGNFGDEVNQFGNGFDVFKQHYVVNNPVVGWTATQADPATHFVRIPHGTNVWQFEATRGAGIATGLCVSDPGSPDLLVLRGCNNGPWQQFTVQSDNTLRNAATGLLVNPGGTGVQLHGGTAPTTWGGSAYSWTDFRHLA